jgi:esterase/lipase superfamily enzyme
MGTIERPAWWTIRKDNREEFFVILNRTNERADEFYGHLSQRVAGSGDAFVFVHGYNVEFDDAVFTAAQIAHDLSFAGAPIVYSWRSRGTFFGNSHDATTSQQSIGQLKQFLLDIARRTSAKTIHLITHSMGNLPLTRAVADLAGSPEMAKFCHLILAGPDIDGVVFKEQIAPQLTRSGPRITLYASSKDNALLASKVFNGAIRAGDSTDVLVIRGIDPSTPRTS